MYCKTRNGIAICYTEVIDAEFNKGSAGIILLGVIRVETPAYVHGELYE